MRRLTSVLAACFVLVACEARSPEPAAREPARDPAAVDAPAQREARPSSSEAADGLEQVAGIHYLELVTGGAEPEATLPMIVAIHGLGDTPDGFASVFAGFDRPARVILPRGLDARSPGWSWFPLRAWGSDVEALAQGIASAADRLVPAVEQLTTARPTVGKPIVTGFSQGGMLSFTLAVRHGPLFAAALPIGGWLPEPLWPAPDADPHATPPILAFHGDADERVPYEPTRAVVEHLREAGYRVELRSYEGVGHTIPRSMHADLVEALRARLTPSE